MISKPANIVALCPGSTGFKDACHLGAIGVICPLIIKISQYHHKDFIHIMAVESYHWYPVCKFCIPPSSYVGVPAGTQI